MCCGSWWGARGSAGIFLVGRRASGAEARPVFAVTLARVELVPFPVAVLHVRPSFLWRRRYPRVCGPFAKVCWVHRLTLPRCGARSAVPLARVTVLFASFPPVNWRAIFGCPYGTWSLSSLELASSFAHSGLGHFLSLTQGLRRGLHSFAAPRLGYQLRVLVSVEVLVRLDFEEEEFVALGIGNA